MSVGRKKLSVCQNYVAAFSCCGKFLQYQLTINISITYVELTVSFKTASINFTANVTEAPGSTLVPTTPGMTIFCSFLLALLMPFVSL